MSWCKGSSQIGQISVKVRYAQIWWRNSDTETTILLCVKNTTRDVQTTRIQDQVVITILSSMRLFLSVASAALKGLKDYPRWLTHLWRSKAIAKIVKINEAMPFLAKKEKEKQRCKIEIHLNTLSVFRTFLAIKNSKSVILQLFYFKISYAFI